MVEDTVLSSFMRNENRFVEGKHWNARSCVENTVSKLLGRKCS